MEQYKASLPHIAATDKGNEPLVVDTIQGHPAREIFSLICADMDFFIQLREQVIEAVATFFNSFSIRRLSALGSLEAIAAKEEKVLNWGETDSVQIALQRRVYIVSKYRELLLRKFLEARRHNFVSGMPTTAIDLKVLELLTATHHFSLKVLLRQVKEHKLEWTRPSNSLLFEGDNIDYGYFIPRNHRTIFSTCWIRTKILVDGSWLIVEEVDYWRPITRPVDSRNWELLPQWPYIDDLAPICAFIEPVQDIDSRAPFYRIVRDLWAEVCVAVVQFSLIGCLCSVSTVNRCRDIIVPLVDIEEIPTGFRGLFQNGLNTNSFATFLNDVVEPLEEQVLSEVKSFSSDDSIFYRYPSQDVEPSVLTTPAVHVASVPTDFASLSSRNSDISLPSPHQSPSTDSSMHFNAEDISLGTDTVVAQILLPTTAGPTIDLSEQFAQLRASISQLSIKKLKTQSSIDNLQNHILSRIDDLEKASANARTQHDQDLRGHFESIRHEVQIQKTALFFEVHEFKQGVRARDIFSTDLATIHKEVRDLSKEFDDKLAVIHNDLLEFRVETQGQLASLSTNLAELIAFVTKGRDDKKGEVGSSHG
ncbi:hypothetical protein F511_06131 [Dorcoceras hygrometricum]|uniref:Uncharacterized protein n=1 Tax=Dorcoceras hygrometricum TaxID=472368 RepID=A0A2Z7BFR7_9LAMI|nr:hypothetical protein F511_06131 [Dorcoceras hygrometricum]